MRKHGLLTGLILCLLTACLLSGMALAASGGSGSGSGTTPAPKPATSGKTGDLEWKLDNLGKLTISGSNSMPDYAAPDPDTPNQTDTAPWMPVADQIKTVEIGPGVTTVGANAFYGVTKLTQVSFPQSLTTVGASAFEKCEKLTSAILPHGLDTIKTSAFSGCKGLGSVLIPSTVKTIEGKAFHSCGLTALLLPSSVYSIGDNAFDSCTSLPAVHYGGSYATWHKKPVVPGNPNKEIPIHYNLEIGLDETFKTCNENLRSEYRLFGRCKECSYSFEQREPIPNLEHIEESVKEKPATCTEAGYTAGSRCSRADCDKIFNGLVPIDPLGHDFDEAVEGGTEDKSYVAPTCTKAGSMPLYQTCNRGGCGYTELAGRKTIPPQGHEEPKDSNLVKKTVQTPSTCSAEGTELHTFRCTSCRDSVTTEEKLPIDPNKHTKDDGFVAEGDDVKPTCTTDGYTITQYYCRDCFTKLDPDRKEHKKLGHLPPSDPSEIKEEIITRPSCKPGTKMLTYTCAREGCGAEVKGDPIEIPAIKEHTWITDPDHPAVAPTCMASGLSAKIICSECGEVKEEQKNIPVDLDAHAPGDPEKQDDIDDGFVKIETKSPNCTEDGSKTTTVFCKLCHEKLSEETEVLPAAHTFAETDKGTEQIKVKPKCDKPGIQVTTKHCTLCDKDIELPDSQKEIPALGGSHEYGEWETLDEVGGKLYQKRTCTRCGFEEFRFIAPVRTITLDLKGGTLPEDAKTTLETGEDGKLTTALPTPTRTDYRFDGWFDAETNGKLVDESTVFTSDTTLFAYWTLTKMPDDGWTVTFDPNEGTLGDGTKTAQTGQDGKLAALPKDPTRSGYAFSGWYDAKTGGKQADKDTVFTANTTLYAHWTQGTAPGEGFTVTLDANEGALDGNVKTVTTGADGKLAAMPKDPTRSGYTFDGWYDAKTGGTKITASTVFTGNSTIYAHWTETAADGATYAIRTDDTDHGKLTPSISSAAKGAKITVYADPDSGYRLSTLQVTDGSGARVTVTRETDTRYTFTMPGSLVNITGSFTRESSSGDAQDPTSGSWNTGAVWNTTDTSRNPDPVPVMQSVPQINAYGQAFLDVPQSHWAAGEIAWAAQNSYMNGMGNGVFAPDRPITHQQLWTVLTRLLRYTNVSDANLQSVRQGLLDGGGPASPVTRQEMVTALYRCAFLLGGARQPSVDIKNYPDSARVSGFAREAMGWAITNGILTGTADGRLNPGGTVTRAQFAVFLFRFSQRYR